MRFKLDENIGGRGADLLGAAGHDVATVRDEALEGAPDEKLYSVCMGETRALITLDRDFGQVLRFPPERTSGIAILDLGSRASPHALLNRIRDLIQAAKIHNLDRSPWIVEPGRIRIHLNATEDRADREEK